jgi:SAM-dependent methyltransferase
MGLSVTATDVSPSGLAICAAWLARQGLPVSVARHEMGTIPFPDCTFDGLVAYNVIYHTTVVGMTQVLGEASRVMRPEGRLYATIVARQDSMIASYRTDVAAGKCVEIEPFTFVFPRDAPGDKHLPHHYSDEMEVRGFFAGFVVDDLHLVRVEYADEDGVVQTGAYYHIQAHRP